MRRELTGYQEAGTGELALRSGTRMRWRQFSWTPQDGVAVALLQVYATLGATVYTGTATTPVTKWSTYEPAFRFVFENLAIGLAPPTPGPSVSAPVSWIPDSPSRSADSAAVDPLAADIAAVEARPDDVRGRLGLAARMLGAGRVAEAFVQIGACYAQALGDDFDAAMEVDIALGQLSGRLRSEGALRLLPPLPPYEGNVHPPPYKKEDW